MTIVTFYTVIQFNELVVLECMLQALSFIIFSVCTQHFTIHSINT